MNERGVHLCHACHRFIHRSYTEKDLGRHLNSLEKLLEDERVRNFVNWVKRQG